MEEAKVLHLARVMVEEIRRQDDEGCVFGCYLDADGRLDSAVVDGQVDFLELARAVLRSLS